MRQVLVATAAVLCMCSIAFGEIPQLMGYQGRVTDNSGNPVPGPGPYLMRFRICTAPTGGTVVWDSGDLPVPVSDGVFSVTLGESPQPALALAFDQDYWLLVTFEGENQTPRKRFGSVGYAHMASGLVPGTEVVGEVLTGSMAAIKGINAASAGATAGVQGVCASPDGSGLSGVCVATTGVGRGVFGETLSSDGAGVLGLASSTVGSPCGVRGEAGSIDGAGIRGFATASDGYTYGVYGEAASTLAHAVHGYATATSGYADGVFGMSQSTDGKGVHGEATAIAGLAVGVFGRTASSDGHGVWGSVAATTGYTYGVYGSTASVQGKGVCGDATNTTGGNCGVVGSSVSPYGTGVSAIAWATTGFARGVHGMSDAMDGTGVEGWATATTDTNAGVFGLTTSTDGTGVFGWASSSTGENYGVYGHTNSTTSGWGGYFEGDVKVNGSVFKTTCNFLIDHPLDPEGKLLRYSCVESPEYLLIYRGKVRLGGTGQAVVELPNHFAALSNEDGASIHLTPVGSPFLTGADWNPGFQSFTVYGESDRSVFWEVLAERDDPVIRHVAQPVEMQKGPDSKFCDRGRLLHPTAYGYPESMGRNHERRERQRVRIEEGRQRMEEERARMGDERARMVDAAIGLRQ
jgi:hypothetical protein